MSVYAIFTYDVSDPEVYGEYAKGAGPTFAGRSAKVLAVDPNSRAIEGENCNRSTVVLEFESEADFEDWYNSPAYQAVVGKRHAGTTNGRAVLVKGL